MTRSAHTLSTLLEELKKSTPLFEVDQFFETIKSIYPTEVANKRHKNIILEGKEVTKPLAVSRKGKRNFRNDKSPFAEFFKDFQKGDFLKVVEVYEGYALCMNCSLKSSILEKYYNDEETRLIRIVTEDVINGTLKRVFRGVGKYI